MSLWHTGCDRKGRSQHQGRLLIETSYWEDSTVDQTWMLRQWIRGLVCWTAPIVWRKAAGACKTPTRLPWRLVWPFSVCCGLGYLIPAARLKYKELIVDWSILLTFALESTESIGAGILGDLRGQREQIIHTRNTLLDADSSIDKASRTLKGMARR